jgi:hypothetical protein
MISLDILSDRYEALGSAVQSGFKRIRCLNCSCYKLIINKPIWLSPLVAFLGTSCLLLSSCCIADLRFQPPTFTAGKHYSSPDLVYNNGNGLSVNIGDLISTSGSTSFGFGEIIASPPHPFGTGQMIHLGGTALYFDLTQGTRHVEFEYLDQGGLINLRPSGGPKLYTGNMWTMPASSVINGITVTKSSVIDFSNPAGVKIAEKGKITLSYPSDIGSMMLGGSEMFLDNFCLSH